MSSISKESTINKPEPAPPIAKDSSVSVWLEERLKISAWRYPIPEHANTVWYSLGGTVFMGFIILLITGIYMAQFYNPSLSGAHDSIKYIVEKAPLGWFVRGLHYWTVQLLFATLLFHIGRVVLTAAHRRPREITYYIGLALFMAMLGMVFTGTIVKWDQEGYEALQHFIGTAKFFGPLGSLFSPKFTSSTHLISRIFSIHTSLLPIIIISFVAVHFYLVKALKISPLPTGDELSEKTSIFNIHAKHLIKIGLGFLTVVAVLALLIQPPLAAAPTGMESGGKPPWMFLWLYFLENYIGLQAVAYGILALVIILAALPLVDRRWDGHWLKRPAAVILAVLIVVLIVFSIGGYLSAPQIHTGM